MQSFYIAHAHAQASNGRGSTSPQLLMQQHDTPFYETRPPVEGRDSLKRSDKSTENISQQLQQHIASQQQQQQQQQQQYTNYVPPLRHGAKPEVKALPLRNIQRPDGQSPEQSQLTAGTTDPYASTAQSPVSVTAGVLTPVLQSTQLFPSRAQSHLDLPIAPEFEYDDSIYVPDLPGSYFSMDPSAYTLTWQQQPQQQLPPQQLGKKVTSAAKSGSQQTVDSLNAASFC